jgi:hypothetical protein
MSSHPQKSIYWSCRHLSYQTTPKFWSKVEGPEKANRGGEWEPIKITHSNLTYIPNFKIRHAISPEKNGQVNSDKFSALVKSDEFSTLVKSDKTDKFPALVKSDEFSALVKSDKTDKFSALVKSDEFSALVKSTRKTVYLLSGISPNT